MKLTHKREGGTGYWSSAKKYALMQRLGAIEHQSETLINQICDSLCRLPRNGEVPADQLDEFCECCPLTILDKLIGGEYPDDIGG